MSSTKNLPAGTKRSAAEPAKRPTPAATCRALRKTTRSVFPVAPIANLFYEQLLKTAHEGKGLDFEADEVEVDGETVERTAVEAARAETNLSISKDARVDLSAYVSRRAHKLIKAAAAVARDHSRVTVQASDLASVLNSAQNASVSRCHVQPKDSSYLLRVIPSPAVKRLVLGAGADLRTAGDFKQSLRDQLASEIHSIARQAAAVLAGSRKRVDRVVLRAAIQRATGETLVGDVPAKPRVSAKLTETASEVTSEVDEEEATDAEEEGDDVEEGEEDAEDAEEGDDAEEDEEEDDEEEEEDEEESAEADE